MSYVLTNKSRAVLEALKGFSEPVDSKTLAAEAAKSAMLDEGETVSARGVNAVVNGLVRRGLATRVIVVDEDGAESKLIEVTPDGQNFDVNAEVPAKEADTAF